MYRCASIIFCLLISLSVHATNLDRCTIALSLEKYVQNYAELVPGIPEMIELGICRFTGKKPTGYCYRAVKNLMLDSGVLQRRVDGTLAASAHTKNFLKQRGFIDLMTREPYSKLIRGALDPNIPVGALLVYEGGNGSGHIEIKCGENCYMFDAINDFPGGVGGGLIRSPGVFEAGEGVDRRRLIGVYILDYFSLY